MVELPSILASIPVSAESPFRGFAEPFWQEFTNSFVVTIVVTLILLLLARRVTQSLEVVPTRRFQNAFEALMVVLYNGLEGIVGKHMITRCFPLLATIFLFTVTSNWLGLFPGMGTIGFGPRGPMLSLDEHQMVPLLRPVMADLNTTLGMAAIFMVFWLIWTFQELGVGGFIAHTFAPKGGVTGKMWLFLLPIFVFVGLIEVVSIGFRPVSLSLRLFGNVYAGENLMHVMQNLGYQIGLPGAISFIMSVLLPLPFFFLELLVGVLQAVVFTLLCAVYIQLSTSHESGHAEGGHSHDAKDLEKGETSAAPAHH